MRLSVYGAPTAVLAKSTGFPQKNDRRSAAAPSAKKPRPNPEGDSQVARAMQEARLMRNRQAHLSAYGAPTGILARSIGFGPVNLVFSSSPKRQTTGLNRQVHIPAYGSSTAILARSIGFGPVTVTEYGYLRVIPERNGRARLGQQPG